MTTVVYRDGILAADSIVCDGRNVRIGSASKIVSMPDGSIAAGTGEAHKIAAVMAWLRASLTARSRRPPYPQKCDEASVLHVTIAGELDLYTGNEHPVRITDNFFAMGSGGELAYGALEQNASAERAVEVAIMRDIHSGGPIVWAKVKRE